MMSLSQIEFDELKGSSVIAATIAWDNALSWSYAKAIAALKATLVQVHVIEDLYLLVFFLPSMSWGTLWVHVLNTE